MLVQAHDKTYFEVTSTNIDANSKSVLGLSWDTTANTKTVLGLSWDTTSDEFVLRFDNLLSKCCSMTLIN